MAKAHRPGKRELLARWLNATGIQFVLERLPRQSSLLVLNYHRIGDARLATYDSQVFTATPDAFEYQMEFVARHLNPVTLAEAIAWAAGGSAEKQAGFRTLITFDDGYLDNYEVAFPILRRIGIQGVFFIPTSFVGSRRIPWWDAIAFMLRQTTQRQFTLEYPVRREVDIQSGGLENAVSAVTGAYKHPDMKDHTRFMEQVERCTGCPLPDAGNEPCFMDWDQAKSMVSGGMALGAHTHTHRLLGSLSGAEQMEELTLPRSIMRDKTGVAPETLAYPVGLRTSFTAETVELAAKAGYQAAFSYYGGVNRRGQVDRFDIRRVSPDYEVSAQRFQIQTMISATAGRFWP